MAEMRIARYRAVTNADICLSRSHGGDNLGDIRTFVLAVRIGVNDDVCAFSEAALKSGAKRLGEAPIAAVAHDVLNAPAACDPGGIIGAAIVDDAILDDVDTRHVARQLRQGIGEDRGFIEARYLDNQFGHEVFNCSRRALVLSPARIGGNARRLSNRKP